MSEHSKKGKQSSVSLEVISEDEDGQRVDNYLIKRLKGVPKSKIYQIIRKGEVRLDKGRVKPSTKLSAGQTLRIPPVKTSSLDTDALAGQLHLQKHQDQIAEIKEAILFEDEFILVINKPSGLAVHGGSGFSLGLIELLRSTRKEGEFLELVHRLDKDTSGCIVLAKKGAVLRELHHLIREGAVDKRYLALLNGRWKGGRHLIEAPLQKNTLKSGERVVRVSREGKASKTVFNVKERFKEASLVEAELLTGRTHQIRVHSHFAGHPIIGDEKYGQEEINGKFYNLGLKRMFLHAQRLVLPLSVYDEPQIFEAPLDENLEKLLNKLRKQIK
jgi:23S rRNA pseudouridine955/2504/2580 synthase